MISQKELQEWKFRDDGNLCFGVARVSFPTWTNLVRHELYVSLYRGQGEFSVSLPGRAGSFQYIMGNVTLPRSRDELLKQMQESVARGSQMYWFVKPDDAFFSKYYTPKVVEIIWRALSRLQKEA